MDTAALVVSVIGLLGLGGVVGAYANHYWAKRREESAERRAVSRSERAEDREHALRLAELAATARRQLPYEARLESAAPERYVTVLDPLVLEVESILLRLHDPRLSHSVIWVPQLLATAVESFKERKDIKAMALTEITLLELERNAEAFVGGREPTIWGNLHTAWYDHLRPSDVKDYSAPARMERVYDRWQAAVD